SGWPNPGAHGARTRSCTCGRAWPTGSARFSPDARDKQRKGDEMTRLEIAELSSPLGDLTAVWREARLCNLTFSERSPELERRLQRRFGTVERVAATASAGRLRRSLAAYFDGALEALDDLAIDPGGTPFQHAVWTALRRVRPGETTTYLALARAIGAPTAVRAVGAANGANPIWLVIPCHRTIGSDGSLVGYAGGLDRKRWLLTHEEDIATQEPLPFASAWPLPPGGRRAVRAGAAPA